MPKKSKIEADTSATTPCKVDGRAVAREYVRARAWHDAQLEVGGLVYVDSLIEAMLESSVCDFETLRDWLCKIIPGMSEVDADAVLTLKFPSVSDDEPCLPAGYWQVVA